MGSIVEYSRSVSKIEDNRDISQNKIIDTITVKTSDRFNWTTLRRMAPVPQWNQSHPDEPGFYLDFITPSRGAGGLVWTLEAEYGIMKGSQDDPNPLQRKAKISGRTSLIEQPTFFDAKGSPIVNTAGEFIPGVMQTFATVEYSVTKNLAADPAWLQTHLGALNQDAIKIRGLVWQPKTLMLGAVSFGEFIEEERATYSEYQLTIMADPRKWTHELWNVGTVELVQVRRLVAQPGGEKVTSKMVWVQQPIKRGDPPENVEEPVPLDENGRAIGDYLDSPGDKPVKPGTLKKLYFDTQKILNFQGVLPLT